jgi:hypothetical protein
MRVESRIKFLAVDTEGLGELTQFRYSMDVFASEQ